MAMHVDDDGPLLRVLDCFLPASWTLHLPQFESLERGSNIPSRSDPVHWNPIKLLATIAQLLIQEDQDVKH